MSTELADAASMSERERRFELAISNLLRFGVGLSSAIIVCGMVLVFVHHPEYLYSRTDLAVLTRPGVARAMSAHDFMKGLSQGHGRAVISLGLILLVATPVMRVAVSIIGFAYQRDRLYVVITSVVLALLLLSLALGKGG